MVVPLCEVCDKVMTVEEGDLDDLVSVPADCCDRCGLCKNCRINGNHDCD